MITIHCKLLAKEIDICNYITVVFKNLDTAPFGQKYVMCVIYPNWESYIPEIGEVGYLTYKECIAGDTWYDYESNSYIPYKYTNLQFMKFVKEIDICNKNIIL